MGAGELTSRPEDGGAQELRTGEAVMASGRLSVARQPQHVAPETPFTTVQLSKLDETLAVASRTTGLYFSIYLGELDADDDTRAAAEQLHAATERPGLSVLLAVSPGQRVLEIVTGEEAYRRLPDRGCKLAVMSMVASFKEGDLFGGLLSGLRMLVDQAGAAPKH